MKKTIAILIVFTLAISLFAGISVLLALALFVFSVPVGKRFGHALPDNIPNL